jgi:type VI secretion system protein ImpK
MNGDDHTLIPGADDRTLLMPRPGGQPTVVMSRRPPPPKGKPGVELQRLVAGINPLLGAAGVLLALVAQLRATTTHDDPVGLREQLLARVAEFEALAAANGVPRPKVSAARYLLCTFVDEVISATPWGAGGVWSQRNLLQQFHEERSGAEKAFELLERLGEDPEANADLLELFYVCFALGFEGRFRGVPNGRAQLDAIAARVLEVVRPGAGQPSARALSPRWQGVATRRRGGLAVLPLWAMVALAGALLLVLWLTLNARLDAASGPLFRQIATLPSALRVERAAPAAKARVAPLLAADVASGTLAVRDEATRSVITLPADTLFVPGSARIDPARRELLARVARALKGLPGQVAVVGHTDDAPLASLQFPSSWHLSREQALAVMAALVEAGERADRVRAEGRADAEPLAPNSNAAQRARNRRVEIELRLPRPEA